MIRNIFLKIISMISSNYRKENFPKLNGQPNEQNDATKDCSTRKILAQKRIPSLLSLLLLPEAFPLIGCGKDLLVYVIVDRQSECQKQIKNTKLNHTNTIKFFKVSTTVLICEFVHWSIREEDQRTENCQLDSPLTHECNYNTTNDYCNSQSTSRRRTSWLQSCTEIWFRTSTFVFFL